jgi:hypothetical protein
MAPKVNKKTGVQAGQLTFRCVPRGSEFCGSAAPFLFPCTPRRCPRRATARPLRAVSPTSAAAWSPRPAFCAVRLTEQQLPEPNARAQRVGGEPAYRRPGPP